jgi:hypothetical protein
LVLFAGAVPGAQAPPDLKRTCSRCHSLDVVRAQRLTREGWADELRKMEHMGANIRNKGALLDYLARTYKPVSRKKPVK